MPRQSYSQVSEDKKSAKAKDVSLAVEDKIQRAITISKPPAEVFAFWREFSNLAFFMKDVEAIEVLSPTRSHWVIKLKTGISTEWDAEITEEVTDYKISWSSVKDAKVKTWGTVWFEPAKGRSGTVVRLSMNYDIPGGKLTDFAAALTGESPDILTQTNLRRLKAFLETGEIPTTEGQPSGRDEKDDKMYTH